MITNHRYSIFLAVTILALYAFISFHGCGLFKSDNDDNDKGVEEVAVEPFSDENGVLVASLSASSDKTQVVSASASSEIADAKIAFPPGSLAVDTNITVQEGESMASTTFTDNLALGTTVESSGPAVVVTSSVDIDASVPFTLSLPLSTAATLTTDSYDNLIILYRVKKVSEDGAVKVGILTRDKLTIEGSIVKFSTTYFGSYQAAISATLISEEKEAASDSAISTKAISAMHWEKISETNAPSDRIYESVLWTGTEVIIWGGTTEIMSSGYSQAMNTGARYNPATDTWTPMSTTSAPTARADNSYTWTGSDAVFWGGRDTSGTYLNSGGVYSPTTDTWTAMTTTGAPSGRSYSTMAFANSKVFVFGGYDGNGSHFLDDGALYDTSAKTWTTISIADAPEGRIQAIAWSSGNKVFVWGGQTYDGSNTNQTNTGGIYDTATNSWTQMSTTGAPTTDDYGWAISDGKLYVFGGEAGDDVSLTGTYSYEFSTDTWSKLADMPHARAHFAYASTGKKLFAWSGAISQLEAADSAVDMYDIATNTWTTPTISGDIPTAASRMSSVWAFDRMFVFGGAMEGASPGNPILRSKHIVLIPGTE